jgi:hypothetical protein
MAIEDFGGVDATGKKRPRADMGRLMFAYDLDAKDKGKDMLAKYVLVRPGPAPAPRRGGRGGLPTAPRNRLRPQKSQSHW